MAFSPRRVPEKTHATTIVNSIFADELNRGLIAAVEKRKEATPSPTYSKLDFPRPFRAISQLQRAHFKPAEAEKLRQLITDSDYWRREVEAYEAAVNSFKETMGAMADWRDLARGYKCLLPQIGFSREQVDEYRLSISDPTYWKSEAEHFMWKSKTREHEIKERVRRRAAQQRQSNRKPSPHPKSETEVAGPVSSRTRSRNTSGGVTKRQIRNERARRQQS